MTKLTTIDFHDDTLFAVEDGGAVYVAVKPICDSLGLAANKQRERIQADPILREGGTVTVLPSAGGPQDTFCLRLDLVNGWLFTIDAARVRPEIRDRVMAYKRECFAVLCRHFYGDRRADAVEMPPTPAREESAHIRRQLVTEARQTFGCRAAGSLWFALGLPIVPEMREPGRQGVLDLIPTAPAA